MFSHLVLSNMLQLGNRARRGRQLVKKWILDSNQLVAGQGLDKIIISSMQNVTSLLSTPLMRKFIYIQCPGSQGSTP